MHVNVVYKDAKYRIIYNLLFFILNLNHLNSIRFNYIFIKFIY